MRRFLNESAVYASASVHRQKLRGALFLTGLHELDARNQERLLSWWQRWSQHTGRAPDIAAHVRQRIDGLPWPSPRGVRGRR